MTGGFLEIDRELTEWWNEVRGHRHQHLFGENRGHCCACDESETPGKH
jgi:hypothetical protein